MGSARLVGAIVWIMISDIAGASAGLVAGWLAMTGLEPLVGELSGCILLVSLPLGLCMGGLAGVASLGWLATAGLFQLT